MANTITPFAIEMWAREALERLDKNQVMGALVSRDFETEFANNKGEIIHTKLIGTFTGRRLTNGATIVKQDMASTGVDIKLDQLLYVAFPVSDKDLNKHFPDLIETYIEPAIIAISEQIDRITFGMVYSFIANQTGSLSASATYNQLVDTNRGFSNRNCPASGRWLVGSPDMESDLLKTDKLTEARMTGDGSPIIEGTIGRGSGFDIVSSTIASRVEAHAPGTFAINNGLIIKGTTVLTIDAATTGEAADILGAFVNIDGHLHVVTASDITSNAGDVTIWPGLFEAVTDGDVFGYTIPGETTSSYVAGWDDYIEYDGTSITSTAVPEVGQGVCFGGVRANIYSIIEMDVTNTKFKLNRPLDAALSDGDNVGLVPAGNYSFAFRAGAVTLAVKAMPSPGPGSGVMAQTIAFQGYQLRTILSFDHDTFTWTYSVDALAGVKMTNVNQGAVFLSALL